MCTAEELKALHQEANALRLLRESADAPDYGRRVFSKVFTADVQRLVSMSDMWKNRAPPTPLVYDDVLALPAAAEPAPPTATAGLRDQRQLSLRETVELFESSLLALAHRRAAELKFDKDDDDIMDFVAATATLRAHVFGIDRQTRFAAKSMAGNIIPAIATTNGACTRELGGWRAGVEGGHGPHTARGRGPHTALIACTEGGMGAIDPTAIAAGLIVLQALHVLAGELDQCANIYLKYGVRSDHVIKRPGPPRSAGRMGVSPRAMGEFGTIWGDRRADVWT